MFYLWFIFHVLFAFTLFFSKRLPYYLSFLVFLPIAFIYLKKQPTYDLIFYYDFFVAVWDFLDPGFRFLILILNKMLAANSFLIHIAYQFISMIFIYIASRKLFFDQSLKKTNLYFFVPVTAISLYTLFYLLGSQNALRQYFGFVISFIGFLYLLNNQNIKAFLLFVLSITFHKMIFLYLPLYFLIKIFKNQKLLIYTLSFFGGLCIYILLVVILSDYSYVQFYLSFQDEHFGGRSGIIKVILLTLSIFVTTYIFRSCKEFQSEKIKLLLKLRMTIFFYALIFAFVGFYELWGRVIFVFYFLDLLFITHIAYKNTTQKYRFACALIILSYAIAPNAKNILSG